MLMKKNKIFALHAGNFGSIILLDILPVFHLRQLVLADRETQLLPLFLLFPPRLACQVVPSLLYFQVLPANPVITQSRHN